MTELSIIGSRGQPSKIHINSITVGDLIIEPVKNARDLGSWFDEHMAMDIHIGNINKNFVINLSRVFTTLEKSEDFFLLRLPKY